MEAKGRESLREAEPDIAAVQLIRIADMRYLGQGYEVAIPFTRLADLPERFGSEYRQLYGPRNDEAPVEIINVRAIVVGLTRTTSARPGSSTTFRESLAKPGDAVELTALMDAIVAVSACPMDLNPISGFRVRDIELGVR